jgi:tyrosyl-tRNA synthetase
MTANLLQVLTERGLLSNCTDPALAERLSAPPATAYIGFDPTADSLGVGGLVPLMGLYWVQQCGHRPLALVGGGTGLVGDPSGKSETRKMLSYEQIAENGRKMGQQFARILRFDDSPSGAKLVNNADWLRSLSWIELLREAGPCFSVNRMLTMDSVRVRLESGSGITFLEFNYMVMQAYDFLHLHRTEGCILQLGGQDQWGNIVMGVELVRRLADAQVYGITFPLLTKADGTKFGKTESGNVWLSEAYTPVYEFFQFWRNAADADVKKFLGFFTTLPMDEIGRLTDRAGESLNRAKEVLAYEITKMVHGQPAADKALEDARRAFGVDRDVRGDSIPHKDLTPAEIEPGIGLLVLMVRAGLAQSNGEARRLVQGGGVRVHDEVVQDPNLSITTADVKDGFVLLRAGKKRIFRFDIR